MKIKKTLYIGWQTASYHKDGGAYSVRDFNPTWDKGFKLLVTLPDHEIEVPEVDARGELIESLRRERQEIIIEASAKAKVIEDRIEELLALPSSIA